MKQDKEYLEMIKEEVVEGLSVEGTDFDPDDLAKELYHRDENYNNCDKTTRMCVYREEEISTMVEETLKTLKGYDERCDECACVLSDEDFETVYEDRGEHFGTPCSEQVTTGYECSTCGHSEDY